MTLIRFLVFATMAVSLFHAAARADTVNLGVLSFDTFIPGAGSPGINSFDIGNLTGAFNLAPDFPVVSDVTLTGASLTLTVSDASTVVYQLGDIAPGFLADAGGNPVIQVPSNLLFAKAELTANLSTMLLTLFDGTMLQADSTSLDIALVPSAGAVLVPDTDQALLSVSGSPASPVPEPTTGAVTAIGLLFLTGWLQQKREESL